MVKQKILSIGFGRYNLSLTRDKKEKQNTNDYIRKSEHLDICSVTEFDYVMKVVNSLLSECFSEKEKVEVLSFMIKIIKKDIQIDLLTEIYYKNEFGVTHLGSDKLIPLTYFTELGEKKRLEPVTKKEVDLSKVITIVIPWEKKRMKNAIIDIAECGFKYDKKEQDQNYYFSELDLCYSVNGNHHIASGIVNETGFIEADVYNVVELFNHVRTDGYYWYNSHTNEKLLISKREVGVFDFRIAVLYELSKKKWLLTKK